MVKVTSTFTAGKMNKVVDERLLPQGEYVDGQNIRLGSTETSEVGSIELTRGNEQISNIQFNETVPSAGARCIGALADNANETVYWFINDTTWVGNGAGSPITTTILDMVVSYNTKTEATAYHLISVQEGSEGRSTLNFDHQYLITGVNLVDDLLFWTDNLNPPRCINVKQGYPPPTIAAGIVTTSDNFSAEEIRVIVRPPFTAPSVSTSIGPEQFNFLTERFISFAYRYRYESGEYSATSQFSAPAFFAENFQFSPQSFLNEGMKNKHNIATVTFNTGSALVKSVELLWKNNDNGIIKVMERIKKAGNYADNTDVSRQFNTSKILTVLPDSEILRLYDNVPRFAKAQTLMGNRLIYGNYVENYDLKATDEPTGIPTNLTYECSTVSTELGESDLTAASNTTSGTYTFGGTSVSITDSVFQIDLASINTVLIAGSVLSISLEIASYSTQSQGGTVATNPSPINGVPNMPFTLELDFVLPSSFTGAAQLVASTNFLAAMGQGTAQPMATAELGGTWTDLLNTAIPQGWMTTLSPYLVAPYGLYPVDYGINALTQPIQVTCVGTVVSIQFPAARYCQTPGDTVTDATSWNTYWQINPSTFEVYFSNTSAAPRSLHSNRGYEVGIVYMDAFKRATTAFTSLNNAVHLGCGTSDTKNQINVSIPTSQVGPWWAQTYKFVVKPSETSFETIFANLVFREAGSADAYILLEGENARKVEEGTRLLVKSDMGGPLSTCEYVTVLEKKAQEEGFVKVPIDVDNPADTMDAPAGVYMKIKASGVDLNVPPDAITTTGWKSKTKSGTSYPVIKLGHEAFNIFDEATDSWGDPMPLPAGSRVRMKFKFTRRGKWGGGGYCERRKYKWYPEDFFVGDDYDSVIDWFEEENIKDIIESNNGESEVGNSDACDIDNFVYEPQTDDPDNLNGWGNECTNAYQWYQNPGDLGIKFLVRGTKACGTTDKAKSKVEGEITIFRATTVLIFETLPTNALPDVWYEGADNYQVVNGDHLSGTTPTDVNQDIAAGVAGSVLLSNFNCYCFGNGCESYTIRDSVKGESFSLGNRVTATASQDYGRIRRYADLTYSGVYNDESNVNKLNEFNLGLLNFKPLEDSFGPVHKLVGRKSDILVLQEDKISYVLSGKNLLSDSTGGGTVTATPVVLGTQVARLEEYGISANPESYAEYGYDKFFTDEKRGAVIKLTGGSHTSEQLEVISEYGMRSWFRDVFIAESNEFKLGGYDPYMNEYVLNTTDIELPSIVPCIDCGATYTYQNPNSPVPISFCVELGNDVGNVTITTTAVVLVISSIYDGVSTSTVVSNTHTFVKGSQTPTTADIEISSVDDDITFIVDCVVPKQLILKRMVINSPQYGVPEPQRVHNQLQWSDGSFVSNVFPDNSTTPTYLQDMANTLVTLPSSGLCRQFAVSLCDTVDGFQGLGPIPTDGATLTIMSSSVTATDDFVFNPTYHKIGYLRSSEIFAFECDDWFNIASVLSTATFPALNAQQTTSVAVIDSITAAMPAPLDIGGDPDVLWLIYDYRVITAINLCQVVSETEDIGKISEVCCECNCPASQHTTYTLFTSATQVDGASYITYGYFDVSGVYQQGALNPGEPVTLCVNGITSPFEPLILAGYEGMVDITIDECNCT